MPGMMDTILNLGLNDEIAAGLARETGNERFAYDSYRRFVAMYGDVVLGLGGSEADPFEAILEAKKQARGVELDTELTADDLKELVVEFKTRSTSASASTSPRTPGTQLWGAVGAVFGSWENPRAITYRKLNDIPDDWGTAVNVQAMVFGNIGDDCATGVAFTRNPSTGENQFYGEYLVNAQGEDVVAGIRTPQPVDRSLPSETASAARRVMPDAFAQLVTASHAREALPRHAGHRVHHRAGQALHAADPQRQAHRPRASVKIAVDLVNEGADRPRAKRCMRIEPEQAGRASAPDLRPQGQDATSSPRACPPRPALPSARSFSPRTTLSRKWRSRRKR